VFRSKQEQLIRDAFQQGYEQGLSDGYQLGWEMGKMEQRNKDWVSQTQGLSLAEKQALVILEKEEF